MGMKMICVSTMVYPEQLEILERALPKGTLDSVLERKLDLVIEDLVREAEKILLARNTYFDEEEEKAV